MSNTAYYLGNAVCHTLIHGGGRCYDYAGMTNVGYAFIIIIGMLAFGYVALVRAGR